ncbi:VOC family protein [Haloferula sargassicola]|uniref:PhnB-like domain-containing protein n=1 Tax=Haloferula sargassicola TaxID=490096 RepID=A0ABP9UPW3_9BACT
MNAPKIEPYLMFSGRCQEALEFYKSALHAEIGMVMRFRESPDQPPMPLPEEWNDKVMHSEFTIGESRIMASDGCPSAMEPIQGVMLSLTMPDEAAAKLTFATLVDGGEVLMPIGETFWSPCFGMVKDKFGVGWMITVPETQA